MKLKYHSNCFLVLALTLATSASAAEITCDKKIVWEFNEFELVGNGLACRHVLEDNQAAMMRKKLKALK